MYFLLTWLIFRVWKISLPPFARLRLGQCCWCCRTSVREITTVLKWKVLISHSSSSRCISFILPSAECDLHLTSVMKGTLSAIVFLGNVKRLVDSWKICQNSNILLFLTGMMVGGYIWGGLGDSLGRRGVLMVSMVFNSLFAMGSAFALDFPSFVTLRFISALGYDHVTN